MSKAIAKNGQWQARVASFSTHSSRKGVNLLGWDKLVEESMTPQQERDVLVKWQEAYRELPAELRKREDLKEMYAKACIRTAQLRGRPPRARELESFILDVVKEEVSTPTWTRWVAEARRRLGRQIAESQNAIKQQEAA